MTLEKEQESSFTKRCVRAASGKRAAWGGGVTEGKTRDEKLQHSGEAKVRYPVLSPGIVTSAAAFFIASFYRGGGCHNNSV